MWVHCHKAGYREDAQVLSKEAKRDSRGKCLSYVKVMKFKIRMCKKIRKKDVYENKMHRQKELG